MRLSLTELLPLLGAGAVLVVQYFGRYVVLPFASHLVGVWLWKRVVKGERQAATIWTHHKLRIMRQGHRPKTPHECNDGRCVSIS